VTVPAVLAQQRRGVPEPGHRLLGHVERPEPGSGGQVGDPHQARGVGEFPGHLPRRGGAAPLAHGYRLLWGGLPQTHGMWRATSASAKLQRTACTTSVGISCGRDSAPVGSGSPSRRT
jgi:hypothetical protein